MDSVYSFGWGGVVVLSGDVTVAPRGRMMAFLSSRWITCSLSVVMSLCAKYILLYISVGAGATGKRKGEEPAESDPKRSRHDAAPAAGAANPAAAPSTSEITNSTSVYITGLPHDVTVEEIKEVCVCGVEENLVARGGGNPACL